MRLGSEIGCCVFCACWCGAGLDLGGRLAKYVRRYHGRYIVLGPGLSCSGCFLLFLFFVFGGKFAILRKKKFGRYVAVQLYVERDGARCGFGACWADFDFRLLRGRYSFHSQSFGKVWY